MAKENPEEGSPLWENKNERRLRRGIFRAYFAASQLAEKMMQMGNYEWESGRVNSARECYLKANNYFNITSSLKEVFDIQSEIIEERIKKTLALPEPKPKS